MSTAELKSTLHKLIVETDDIDILAQIKEVFFALKSGQLDWADLLSDKERRMMEKGIIQADKGQLISHEQMRKNIKEWIKEKRK